MKSKMRIVRRSLLRPLVMQEFLSMEKQSMIMKKKNYTIWTGIFIIDHSLVLVGK